MTSCIRVWDLLLRDYGTGTLTTLSIEAFPFQIKNFLPNPGQDVSVVERRQQSLQ